LVAAGGPNSSSVLMFKTSCPSKNRSNAEFVAGINCFLIADESARPHHHVDSGIFDGIKIFFENIILSTPWIETGIKTIKRKGCKKNTHYNCSGNKGRTYNIFKFSLLEFIRIKLLVV